MSDDKSGSVMGWLWQWLQRLLPGLLVAVIAFELLPAIDLQLARLFYRPGTGFFLDGFPPVQWLYRGVPWLARLLGCALLATLAWTFASARARTHRGIIVFALASLALGPGFVANTVLKDHWGRPRPEQLAEFGGHGSYVSPLVPSRQCEHNCAFVSGHAAVGFWLITGAWMWPRQRRWWLIAGCTTGALVGLARIAQGGHFFSDVLGALVVVWLTNALLHRWMLGRRWLPAQPVAPAKR